MKKALFFLLIIFITTNLYTQPTIQWQKALGGSKEEEAYSIGKTSDGGYVVAGYTRSNNGNVTGMHGKQDMWVVKLNANGTLAWQKTLGGSDEDVARSIQQTSDGGYIVVGITKSNDGDVSGNHGAYDGWAVKLSSIGDIQWQRALGGTGWEGMHAVQQTSDGGYVMVGDADSDNGDIVGYHGLGDVWVVKLSGTGDIQWQKSLGGTAGEKGRSIQQTSDGGYIVAGYTASKDGDVSGHSGGWKDDYWLVKITNTGDVQWQNTVGGSGDDEAYSVKQTNDGGYIVAGYTDSEDGDVTGNKGSWDYWVVKFNSTGVMQWQKTYGGSNLEWAYSVELASGGGYIVAGLTGSTNGDVSGMHGYRDFWIIGIDGAGSIQWKKAYGGSDCDDAFAVLRTSDEGYVVAGATCSYNGDVSGNHGSSDFWVVKLSPLGSVGLGDAPTPTRGEGLEVYPNPATNTVRLKAASEDVSITVNIVDLLGRTVLYEDITNGGEVDVSSLSSGVYFVTANTTSGQIFSSKLCKQD